MTSAGADGPIPAAAPAKASAAGTPPAPRTATKVPVRSRTRPSGGSGTTPARSPRSRPGAGSGVPPQETLCIDIGGSAVKGATIAPDGTMLGEKVRLDTTYPLAPEGLVDMIAEIARRSPAAQRCALGFPGMVRAGKVLSAPHFVTTAGPGTDTVPELARKWDHFHLSGAVDTRLGLPTRLANDADTQGLAAIEGDGLELVITLGTGIGTAIFLDGGLAPHIELSHHPLTKKYTYNEYVGEAARKKVGNAKWSARVQRTVEVLQALTFYDRLYIGGGNGQNLTKAFTHEHTTVSNADGILGGAKLWTLHRVP
jgi:polyphosphate glucokinase